MIKASIWHLSVFNAIDVYTGIQMRLQPNFSVSIEFFSLLETEIS